MYVSSKQYESIYKLGHEQLRKSWYCKVFLRNPVLRDWIVKTTCDSIKSECSLYGTHETTPYRDNINWRVLEDVTKANKVSNGDGTFGFVIWPIILASIISWLIQMLLDHLFNEENQS